MISAEALSRSGALGGSSRAVAHADPTWARWVAPAPFTIKMRLFCLPYAGGVSENVFARCALSAHRPELCKVLRQAPLCQQELQVYVGGAVLTSDCVSRKPAPDGCKDTCAAGGR